MHDMSVVIVAMRLQGVGPPDKRRLSKMKIELDDQPAWTGVG